MKKTAIYLCTILMLLSCTKTEPNNNNNTSSSLFDNSFIAGVWTYYGPGYIGAPMDWHFVVFFKDGKALDNMPSGGFDKLAANKYYDDTRNNPLALNIGKYTFSGTNGQYYLTETSTTPDELVKTGTNKMTINGKYYSKCVNLDGVKFDGAYTTYFDPQDPALQALPIGQRPVITFYSDGSFYDEGIFNTYEFLQSGNSVAPGTGWYAIKNYSITLSYDDGRTRQEGISIPFGAGVADAKGMMLSRTELTKFP
ncbi:MAG: hypothetical protein RL660_1351 [Bacteroidota bacterium]|jgi:hypothetical protein